MRAKFAALMLLSMPGLIPPGWAGDLTVDDLAVVRDGVFYGRLSIQPGIIPTNGLRLFYNFDTNESGIVTDLSGNGNTGTVFGATWTPNGKIGGAYNFNGTNNYIQAADSDSLDIRGAFTVSAWVKRTGTSPGAHAIVAKHDDGTSGRAYAIYVNNNYVQAQLSSSGGGGQLCEFRTTTAFALTNWTHVVVLWDGTPNAGEAIYVDGAAQQLFYYYQTFQGTNIFNSSQPLRIGAKSNGGWWFPGVIDEVRLYDRALTSGEVALLYAGTGPNAATGVVMSVEGVVDIRRLLPQGDIQMGPYTNGP